MSSWLEAPKAKEFIALINTTCATTNNSAGPYLASNSSVICLADALQLIIDSKFDAPGFRVVQQRQLQKAFTPWIDELNQATEHANVQKLLIYYSLDTVAPHYQTTDHLRDIPIQSLSKHQETATRFQKLKDLLHIAPPISADRLMYLNPEFNVQHNLRNTHDNIRNEKDSEQRQHDDRMHSLDVQHDLREVALQQDRESRLQDIDNKFADLYATQDQERLINYGQEKASVLVKIYPNLTCPRDKLTRFKGTYLSAKFGGVFKDEKHPEGSAFIDRDMEVFKVVLKWLFNVAKETDDADPAGALYNYLQANLPQAQFLPQELKCEADFYLGRLPVPLV